VLAHPLQSFFDWCASKNFQCQCPLSLAHAPPQEAGTGAAQPFQREVVPKEGHQTRRRNRFADAYRHGLDGAQAAWAARKYKGHRVLPPDFLKRPGSSWNWAGRECKCW
ncbi:hypothetical protein B0H10DRAFT_1870634, partial [Mycena sp. CBHHK59/15]